MNAKTLFFLLLIISFLGSSCCSKNILVKNQVTTRIANGIQESNWTKSKAKKQISLKSLRVLIVDETTTQNAAPYEEDFSLRIRTDKPIKVDSLVVESRYYNRILLNAFRKQLPQKADVWMITRGISPEALDSLVRADKYDAVIAAQKIRFTYQFFFIGLNAIQFKGDRGMALFDDNRSIGTIEKSSMMSTLGFHAPISVRQPPIQGRTIAYCSEWTLQRSLAQGENEPATIIKIKQEGVVTNDSDDCESMFVTIAQEAGKSISQVFSW